MSDTEISRLDQCTPMQLKELLALASTDEEAKRNWLLEIGDWEQLDSLLTEMCSGTGQPGGILLQAAVCSPDTPVEVLVVIKGLAKRLAAAAKDAPQNAAATLLYHLSVASALGRHGQNISSTDPSERLALYKELAAELSDDELAAIFQRAIARLSPERS